MTLASTAGPLVASFDALWLDLDGVVYRSADPIDSAIEVLRDLSMPQAFLTNNANRTAEAVAAHLRDIGLDHVRTRDVVTAAQAIATLMADDLPAGAPVMVVGGPGLREAVADAGLTPVGYDHGAPAAVVQGYAPELGWSDLAEASYAVNAGARWYVSNPDLSIPTARGTAPGNGALAQAVRYATGVDPVVAGKPHRPLFDATAERLGSSAPLMVGDRLDTDIAGAAAAGIASLFVLTGVNSVDDVLAATGSERPHHVAPDLRAVHEVHASVTIARASATCGDATATLDTDTATISVTGGTALERLRAVVALGWTHHDASGTAARFDGMIEP